MSKKYSENSIIEYMLDLLNISETQQIGAAETHRSDLSDPRSFNLETAQKIKDFIDEIPGGFLIYSADANEEIVYANKALLKIFRCNDLAEFKRHTGNSFKGVVHANDLDTVEKSISEQIANSPECLDYVEYRIVRKDGIVRWVEDYGHYIHSETAGNFYYVFISDATEKVTRRMAETATIINAGKQKEQQLQNLIQEYDRERKLIRQEHLQRLEVIEGLSVNYDSILYADLDKNMVLPYRLSTRLERQFEKRLQVRELEWFLDDYVKVWVHPDDRENVARKTSPEYIRKKLHENGTYYINYRCIQNGSTQYIQLRMVNVGGSGRVSQVVMGYRNIDEEITQSMKQKQLLEVALNNARIAEVAKNSFLSNMSHDMRTPLNAIFGYTALAKKKAQSPAVADALDKIDTASKQILELVDKVLELSYMESQEFSISEEQCNVCEIASEICDSVRCQAEQKKIELRLNTDGVTHGNVYADRPKLLQVLSHIVGNAIKYTNSGGAIDISVAESKNRIHDLATYAFTIKDTGVGISKSVLERIFEPFERERNTTASGVYGLGLGLTIAKRMIDLMDGNIEVTSEVGKGSTFVATVSLRMQTDDNRIQHDANDAADLAGKKILIVEDNEINLDIETEILEDLGFVIDSAPNGKIAVEKVQNSADGEYTVVLMDIQMPIMDGRTAAAAIRKLDNPSHANIPIIALSANAFESDKRESIEAGMDAHLTKPIDVPLLLKTIEKTLQDR